MKIKVTLNDIKDGMPKFYENMARKMGYNVTDNTNFRCTKIDVSKEIDDYFWKYYEDSALANNPNLSEQEVKSKIAMLMLQVGAKRNEDLEPWVAKVEDGFAFEKE